MPIGIRPGVNVGGGEGYGDWVQRSDATFVVSSRSALYDAADNAQSGDIVYVDPNATIDVQGNVQFRSGVTLASNRGVNGSPGGHIRRTDTPTSDNDPAISVTDARVTGLRLEGPFPNESDPHDGNVVRTHGGHCEVDNCEIWGGGASGVTADAEETTVHHNHIHDNVAAGNGYGVASGGFTEIYANSFEHNRHAIAGSGDESYKVNDNWFSADHTHHVVDMHGQMDGPGGVNLHIHNNKCEADDVPFVQVNGVPEERCLVEKNWIFNPFEPCVTVTGGGQCAIIQTNTTTGWTNFTVRNNHLGTSEPPDIGLEIDPLTLAVLGGGAVAIGLIAYDQRDQLLREIRS